jgi:hypothetical protein
MSILLLLLLLHFVIGKSAFDGEWRLRHGEVEGSCDGVLRLIGISGWKRGIILGLDVTERITLNQSAFHLVRDTRYHTDQVFQIDTEESVNDMVLGDIKQTVHVLNAEHIRIVAKCEDGRGDYISNRRITVPNRITYMTNFTSYTGRKAYCVKYYDKTI